MTARSSSPHPLHIYLLINCYAINKKQLKHAKSDNMTYCKPSQPFQVGEGRGRVEKKGGRTMKK